MGNDITWIAHMKKTQILYRSKRPTAARNSIEKREYVWLMEWAGYKLGIDGIGRGKNLECYELGGEGIGRGRSWKGEH